MSKKDNVAAVPKYRSPEFLNCLNWKKEELNKLGKVIPGLTYSPQDIRGKGLLVLRSSNIKDNIIDLKDTVYVRSDVKGYTLTEEKDILICVRNGSKSLIGKNALVPKGMPLCTNGAFMIVFRANNPCFVFQLFQSEQFNKQVKADLGATINSINSKQLKKYIFTIPQERKEQQKIADCLSSIDDLISAEEKKLSLLNDYKKGWMQKLFPAEGKTVPEWRFPEFRDSGEWKTTSLGEICGVLNGVGFPIKMQGNSIGKYSFFKVSDISNAVMNNGGILLKAANCIDDNVLLKLRAKTIPRGTTVFAKIGEALRLNRRAITSEECLIDNNVIGVKAKPKKADDYFVFLLLQLIDLERYCGGVIPSVKKTVIEEIEVSFISDLKEQQKIADFISGLVQLIRKQTDKIEALKQHKKALMQGLFPSIEEV